MDYETRQRVRLARSDETRLRIQRTAAIERELANYRLPARYRMTAESREDQRLRIADYRDSQRLKKEGLERTSDGFRCVACRKETHIYFHKDQRHEEDCPWLIGPN